VPGEVTESSRITVYALMAFATMSEREHFSRFAKRVICE
jgi:hypothetical protein